MPNLVIFKGYIELTDNPQGFFYKKNFCKLLNFHKLNKFLENLCILFSHGILYRLKSS